MSNPPLALATSKDLRKAADLCDIAMDEKLAWGEYYDCLPGNLRRTADALDHIHALPGLQEAMGQLQDCLESEAFIDLSHPPDKAVLRRLLDALKPLLLPPGEPQEER